jgi:hypothetical protein
MWILLVSWWSLLALGRGWHVPIAGMKKSLHSGRKWSMGQPWPSGLDRAARQTLRTVSAISLSTLLSLGIGDATPSRAMAEDQKIITRADVGFIDLNVAEPKVTDICWMDIGVGDDPTPQRIEISLYGTHMSMPYSIFTCVIVLVHELQSIHRFYFCRRSRAKDG